MAISSTTGTYTTKTAMVNPAYYFRTYRYGTSANDLIYGNSGIDYIYGYGGDDWLYGYGGSDAIYGGSGYDRLYGGGGNDSIYGEAGRDFLYGDEGDDRLHGGADVDHLYGGSGGDTLEGGTGGDYLLGGYGSDRYVFRAGDGTDWLHDYDAASDGYNDVDTLVFGDQTAGNLRLSRDGNDMIASHGWGDSIRVSYQFYSDAYGVEAIEIGGQTYAFQVGTDASETIYGASGQELLYGGAGSDMLLGYDGDDVQFGESGNDALYGYAGDDTLYGGLGIDTLYGGLGADELYGEEGNDYLFSEAGDDRLYGGAGHDTLRGHAGSDYLSGGYGSDTYRFSAGDGSDTLYDYDTSSDGLSDIDTLRFDGISTWDLDLRREGYDLVVNYGTDGSVRAQYQFYSGNYGVERITVGDRTYDFQVGSGSAESLYGDAGANMIYGASGGDRIYAGAGSDVLAGGNATDFLYGEAGSDILVGGASSDYLRGGAEGDLYVFRRGDGQDQIYDAAVTDTEDDGDTLRIDGYDLTDLEVTKSDSTLTLDFHGTDDRITVVSQAFRTDIAGDFHFQGIETVEIDGLSVDVDGYTVGEGYAYGGTYFSENITTSDSIYTGTAGEDHLRVGYYYDSAYHAGYVYGGAGNDTLEGARLDDIIVGGTGNDVLQGFEGDDTFVFRRGDGQDRIETALRVDGTGYLTPLPGNDTLLLKDFSWDEITLRRDDRDLIIGFDGTSDSVSIELQFGGGSSNGFAIENLQLGDQIARLAGLDADLFLEAHLNETGDTAELTSDSLGGVFLRETFADGMAGKWLLASDETPYAGDDSLSGGSGDDLLWGGDGADLLSGGTGNDELYGGMGADTYVIGRGDGNDTIVEQGRYSSSGTDVLRLEGFTLADIVGSEIVGQTMQINFVDPAQSIILQDHLETIEEISSSGSTSTTRIHGGTSIEQIEINGQTYELADDYSPDAGSGDVLTAHYYGGAGTLLIGTSGDNRLRGSYGDDLLMGGGGSDDLQGRYGSDTYVFRAGDGSASILDYGGSSQETDVDVLRLEGVQWSDLHAERIEGDLVVNLGETGGTVTVRHELSASESYGIEQIQVGSQSVSSSQLAALLDQAGDTAELMSDASGAVFVRETHTDGTADAWVELQTTDPNQTT